MKYTSFFIALIITTISLHNVNADTEDAILTPEESFKEESKPKEVEKTAHKKPKPAKKTTKSKKVVKPKAKTPKRYKLTIKTVPAGATVKITNIKPKYKAGIKLAVGSYNIKVIKAGYETARKTIQIHNNNVVKTIKLKKKKTRADIPKLHSKSKTDDKKEKIFVNSNQYLSNSSTKEYIALHRQGITRKTHPSGLPYPSFNNYLDSGQKGGIDDERKFLVAQNQTTNSKITNKISVKPGDSIYLRAYVANSGYADDPSTTAKNVTLNMGGFSLLKSGKFESRSGKIIKPRFFISSSNARPRVVSDDVLITSSTGKAIKLQFDKNINSNNTLRAVLGKFKTGSGTPLSSAKFFGSGVNVGSITGDNNSPFYVQITLIVVPDISAGYDLTINKTIDGKKQVVKNAGDIITYRLNYKNYPSSTALAEYVKVIDNYDEGKIRIVEKPSYCKDNKGVLICLTDREIKPGEKRFFTYKAKIKENSTGFINNKVEIKPAIKDGVNYDIDINNSNDFSSAIVEIR